MATFSPSPAPRRSSRLRAGVNVDPMRLNIGKASKPPSRFATPGRGSRSPNASMVVDADEARSVASERSYQRISGETVYAKSEELLVTFYAHLPVEVKQLLRNADFYRDAYTGEIDTLTGFALIASIRTCFIWQHVQAVKGIPTCYILPCPQDYNQTTPPFHGLVPHGISREPGLILVSPAGDIRIWDSIGIGLAGGENYFTTSIELASDELVTNLVRSDSQTYIISTTAGRLFRLTLATSGGKINLTSHPFARPASSLSLSRLLPSIFTPSPAAQVSSEPGNINAIALGQSREDGGREVWALIDTRVQKWEMKAERWEEPLLDEEVAELVRIAIRETFGSGVEEDDARMDLELVDLAIDNAAKLVVLASYAGKEDNMAMSMDLSGIRRVYALVCLTHDGDLLKVDGVRSIPYQSTSTSGAPMHPRIQLLRDTLLVSIQFGDTVAICARDSDYRDRLELKSSMDRTLGVGIIDMESAILVLTAATMCKIYVDVEKVRMFDPETGRPNLIKSIMTQAILYGSLPENPLHFSFPPEVEEDSLMQGAQQLSEAILHSDPELVRHNHDLGAQMTSRKERLSWLIQFINDNAVLVKMSQRSRQHLATDAEKLYACHQLWIQHNDLLATSPVHSVLNDTVHAYAAEISDNHHEDVMRAFFRHHVADIDRLLRKVAASVKGSLPPSLGLVDVLPETNRIILKALRSAFDYREFNLGVYGIELPMISPWTSKPAIIDIVLELFDSTTRIVDIPSPDGQAPPQNAELVAQLPELAAVLFACIQERLDWLGSSVATAEPSMERDRTELNERFALLRPEVLETLRRTGHTEAAFTLAEKYRDFSSLAALCHRDVVYPPVENPHALRIQAYIEKFRDEFTMELYQWYLQHGELRVMFAQEDIYGGYMDRFFAQHPHPNVSWIHDLGKGRQGIAAQTLLDEAKSTTNLETKHLMLSIGKLSQLAQLNESGAGDPAILDVFHDELDLVSVHEALLEDFKSALPSRGRQSLESQIETIIRAKATRLTRMSALSKVFKQLLRELLQGRSLGTEDIVDALTLKDNKSTVEDYSTALYLLARAKDLSHPNSRMSASRSVWRRIFIHDDWDSICKTANITDAELNERFRQTTLITTLCAVLTRDPQTPIYELTPDAALVIPEPGEIAARWPGLSSDEIEAIDRDYQSECDRLGALELGDVYYRVKELAQQDAFW